MSPPSGAHGRLGSSRPYPRSLLTFRWFRQHAARNGAVRYRAVQAAIILTVTAAVAGATAIAPLAASAREVPSSAASPQPVKAPPPTAARTNSRPPTGPSPSAATPRPHVPQPPMLNLPALRQQAIAHAGQVEKTASFRVSPAVLSYLSDALGLPLQHTTLFTGVKDGPQLLISLPAPQLRASLPHGTSMPAFSRSTLLLNPATGAATLTSSAPGGTGALRVAIASAASATPGASSALTLRVPVLGQQVALAGQVGSTGAVSLTGHLPQAVAFPGGVANLAADATVTLTTSGGLQLSGPAILGSPGHQLGVTLSGTPTGKTGWSFAVSNATAAHGTPLPGLALASDVTGTVSVNLSATGPYHSTTRFDVHGRTASPWTPIPGISAAGTFEFANFIQNDSVIPAPAITTGSQWADVTGGISVTSAASPISTQGIVTVNLSTGNGLLSSTGGATAGPGIANLPSAPHLAGGLVLHEAGFRGTLRVTGGAIHGSVAGTGQVSLAGQSGQAAHADVALTLTPAGTLATQLDLPKGVTAAALQGSPATPANTTTPSNTAAPNGTVTPGGTARPAGANLPADGGTTSYTLSAPVYNFLTNVLNIPLGSATISGPVSGQTLTASVGAPTALPSSLPSWLPNPSYASAQVVVNEATNTLTLTAATSTSSGVTGTLTITIANASSSALTDGTDVTGTLALTGVPFVGNSTAALTFTLGADASGKLTVSLAGSASDASFAGGVVTIPALTIGLATGSGLTVDGTADINANPAAVNVGGTSAVIHVNGTVTDPGDWSFTVSDDTGASDWQPTTGLSITPDFTGTISASGGTVGFDLAWSPGAGSVASWVSPDQSSTVSVASLEVALGKAPGQAPSSTAACTTSLVKGASDLWVGIGNASFSYAPANLSLSATGCFDLTSGNASITTGATGDLTAEFGTGLPFTVNQAGLTVTVGSSGFSLAGRATVTVNSGVPASAQPPTFGVGWSLVNGAFVAGVGGSNLSSLGLPGSGAIYVATTAMAGFSPSSIGVTDPLNPTVDLAAGLNVSLSYTLPSSVITAFQTIIPGFPAGTGVTAIASLSAQGFSFEASLNLGTGTGTGGLRVTPASDNASIYLDSLDVGVSVGTLTQVTISGTGFVSLPALAPGTSASSFSVTLGGSLSLGDAPTLSVTFDAKNVQNALGVTGLNIGDFGVGISISAAGPGLSLNATSVVLPSTMSQPIGVVQGSQISFNINVSLSQPVLEFSILGPPAQPGQPQQPALLPLSVVTYPQPLASNVVNSFKVYNATFDLAPFGGVAPGSGDSLPAKGVAVIFSAAVAGITANVNATVDLTAAKVDVSANLTAPPPLGPITLNSAAFFLHLSPTSGAFGFTGGISSSGFTYTAEVDLQVGFTADGAGIHLTVTGGLPSYLAVTGTLNGGVSLTGPNPGITASGSGGFDVGGQTVGSVNFSVSIPGPLGWSDIVDTANQIASWLESEGISVVNSVLQQLGYSAYDILNALGATNLWGPQALSSVASAFGFSTSYYNIGTWTSSGEYLLLDVNGGSQAPNTGVITWDADKGYNQDWAFVSNPTPGWYEIVNRGSGQCLSVGNDTFAAGQQLVQYPCNGWPDQLWYLGDINLFTAYYIYSDLDLDVVDVQNAYPWPGGTVDQWPPNEGSNQRFWLTYASN
jgi:hypothetical protein